MGERYCTQKRHLLDLSGLSSGFTNLILKYLRQLRPSMCTSFCPSVGGQLSLWCSESSWSGCSYRHHIETFIDSQQRVIMLMIIFLFISLPAETPFPIFLSLSSESPTRNVLLLRWLSSLGYTLVSNHYI